MHGIFNDFLNALDPAPVRVWSLVATFYGDSILPRGGEVWLGTVTALCGSVGIEASAVRAAMSRLARDGFLSRRRRGRTSHYALSPSATAQSEAAASLIYRRKAFQNPAGWDVILLPGATAQQRANAQAQGYRPALPQVFARPARTKDGSASAVPGAICLSATGDDLALARLLYPIDKLADQYRAFADAVPILSRRLPVIDPHEAMVMRLALVHAFRRISLRDPHLHAGSLPQSWPADAAHAAFFGVYERLRGPSDAWLRDHARNAVGSLPDAPALERFAA